MKTIHFRKEDRLNMSSAQPIDYYNQVISDKRFMPKRQKAARKKGKTITVGGIIGLLLFLLAFPVMAKEPPRAQPRPGTTPGSGLGSPKLNETHSRVKDGFVWQKDANGIWRKVKK